MARRSKKEMEDLTSKAIKLLMIHPRPDGGYNLPTVKELKDIVECTKGTYDPKVIQIAQSIYREIFEQAKAKGEAECHSDIQQAEVLEPKP